MGDNSTHNHDEITFKFASLGEILEATIVLPVLCIIVVTLRFYARSTQKASIGIDD